MRHKYPPRGIVLGRSPLAEESALLTVLTPDLGLVRARAQAVRKRGAKLAAALPTLAESEVILVAGKEGWRLAGALLFENWSQKLPYDARIRVARIVSLILRMVHGESPEPALFTTFTGFVASLAEAPETLHDSAECLAALRILAALGLDAGELPPEGFTLEALALIAGNRSAYIARVNRGIEASGL